MKAKETIRKLKWYSINYLFNTEENSNEGTKRKCDMQNTNRK